MAPRLRAILLSGLVLAFLASPLAAAQLPTPAPPTPAVEITASATDVAVSVERPSTVTLTVKNTTPGTGTPLDQPRTIVIEVAGTPAKWSAGVDPTSLRLPPGGQGTTTLHIAVGADAGEDRAAITVTAKLLPLGVDAVPGIGSTVDPEATATAQVGAHRSDPLTRDILETVGPWIYVLFLALVLAALLVVRYVVQGRRITVAIECTNPHAIVDAGGKAIVPIVIRNLTKVEDTIVFQVSAMPAGWAAFLPVPELQLGPEGHEELGLTIIASKELAPGATQSILVSATGAQAPRRAASVAIEAAVGEKASKSRR